MKILAIETSCDETAVALLDINPVRSRPSLDGRSSAFSGVASNGVKEVKEVTKVKVLGNALLSQTVIHAPMGGIVPSLAKREHGKNLIPMLKQALKEANFLDKGATTNIKPKLKKLEKILEREGDLYNAFIKFISTVKKPKMDVIAVTSGPGLEPALWVGINFAKALSLVWNKPVVAVNHMEGHILSAMLKETGQAKSYKLKAISFPLLSLLISGGHTELILGKKIGSYKIIGETRDDALGEAYDKVGRMLGLPYPGGPQISLLAERARNDAEQTRKIAEKNSAGNTSIQRQFALSPRESALRLPRPMINSKDLDFSFAGLKTAVLYTIKKNFKEKNNGVYDIPEISKMMLAREFEDAVAEVLVSKVRQAIKKTEAKTFAVGGGVIANKNIRAELLKLIETEFPKVKLFLPAQNLTTDNAVMIAISGYFSAVGGSAYGGKKTNSGAKKITANGNWRLS